MFQVLWRSTIRPVARAVFPIMANGNVFVWLGGWGRRWLNSECTDMFLLCKALLTVVKMGGDERTSVHENRRNCSHPLPLVVQLKGLQCTAMHSL